MIREVGRNRFIPVLFFLALAFTAGAGSLSVALAQPAETPQEFWHIPVWAQPGAWQDDTGLYPRRCLGLLTPRSDSLSRKPRTMTVRFLRSRRVEARPDFGGYRVYRCTNLPDTSIAMLIRRYSVNQGDYPLWHFSRVDTTDADSLPFRCVTEVLHEGAVASDSIITFVDPDSSGALGKVCRTVDERGNCTSPRDSVWALMEVPGPHNGFRTWYTVTYEAKNNLTNDYLELFVPDSSDTNRCGPSPWRPENCPNLNSKQRNMIAEPVEPTPGPATNLRTVAVVPNPFRGRESWDRPDGNEVQFVNLPPNAKIRIYTVAGDLVRELTHDATVAGGVNYDEDFERWDLKNANGMDVASGIYVYRIEAGVFSAQNRFIVIR